MNCTKCGLPIDPKESAVRLDVEAGYAASIAMLVYMDKHVRCSPSRAQYVTQLIPPVVDERPEFDKRRRKEAEVAEMTFRYTAAYRRLQSQYCECWLCLNTGPNGECESCGRPPSPERMHNL